MNVLPAADVVGAALWRAGLCDEREIAERVRDDGRRFVLLLVALVRNSRLGTEPAIAAAAGEVSSLLGRLIDTLGTLRLVLVERGIELNGLVLRFSPEDQLVANQLAQEFVRHQLATLTLHSVLDTSATRTLARALAEPAARGGQALTGLAERLATLPGVELSGQAQEEPVSTRDAWDRTAAAISQAYAALALERQPDLATLRRSTDSLATAIQSSPARALATPVWTLSMPYGERHVLAVTSLSLSLGQYLGLDLRALSDLGLAAVLNLAGAAGAARADSGRGLRRLAGPRGFREGKLRRVLTLCEPGALPGEDFAPHLFTRLLRITSDYDLLTTPRPDHPRLAPPMAQAALWAARSTRYDADLLALFVQMMGLYPPGSLCELSDGRAVVVIGGGRDAEHFGWPQVQVVRGGEGQLGTRLDLFETRESLRPKRVLNPGSVPFDQASLFPN